MITDRRLTARLERTLAVKADQANEPAPSAADRSRLATIPGPDDGPVAADLVLDPGPTPRTTLDDRRTAGRHPWRVAVAAGVVAAALVGGLLALPGEDAPESDTTTASVAGPPTVGWLTPAWVPEDATLWGVDATTYDPRDAYPDAFAQLFGDPVSGPAMYVSSPDKEIAPDSARDVTVRGQAGSAGTGWGVAEEDLGPAITWEERGVEITALYRGMTEAEALAALEALEWRSDVTAEGFAATDAELPLLAEGPAYSPASREVSLHYAIGEPDGESGPDLLVSTSTSNVPGAYLEAWYLAGTGDGATPMSTRTGTDHVTLWTVWPDGRSVSVSADTATAPSLTPDVLDDIAGSVAETSDDEVDGLRALVSARVAALPVLAAAETAIGTVEVHGTGGFLRLCRPETESPAASCATSGSTGGGGPDGVVPTTTASWTVDGTWYVAVAARGERPVIVGSTDAAAAPDTGELAAETTADGDWTVALVEVPAELDSVCTGTGVAMSCTQQRPD